MKKKPCSLTVLPRVDPADAWRRGPGGVAHAELVDQALAGVRQADGAAVLLDKNKWEKISSNGFIEVAKQVKKSSKFPPQRSSKANKKIVC